MERNRLIEALKKEIAFLNAGGYGVVFRSAWRPTLLLRDSPACMNFSATDRQHTCESCPFFSLVPSEKKTALVPCHHIPLDKDGSTIAGLYKAGSQEALDQRYRDWLFTLMRELETLRGGFMQALQTETKLSFKNILFLTDFTEASHAALAYALGFARHCNGKLYPAHACDPVILTETAAPDIVSEVEENSRIHLESLAHKNGMTGTPLFARGTVESAFPRWIADNNIDLIIMGTHGRHGLKHLLLGSVAEGVFRQATCPVLTVGPHVAVRPYHEFKVESILCPTDLGPSAKFTAEYALTFAEENQAEITFMNVVSLDAAFQNDRRTLIDAAYKNLDKLVPNTVRRCCNPKLVVEVGDPAKELLGYAETERPDLIVLGLPPDKKFNGHFRAGVTYNLVSSASCPVLTIRNVQGEN